MDHSVAGTLGAAAGLLVGYPLDLAKVRLQAQSLVHASSAAVSEAAHFTGVYDCLSKTVRHGGPRSLFAGATTPLIASIPGNAFLFGAYGRLLRRIEGVERPTSSTPASSIAMAGSGAGASASIIATPVELIKCRMQNQCANTVSTSHVTKELPYRSSWQCAVLTLKQGGVRALYRGAGLTALRDCIGVGTYFSLYHAASQYLKPRIARSFNWSNKWTDPLVAITTGGTSGIVSWAVVHPIDVVKSRIQITKREKNAAMIESWQVAKNGYQSEGVRFFTRGLVANSLRAFPMCGCTFLVYEAVLTAWPR